MFSDELAVAAGRVEAHLMDYLAHRPDLAVIDGMRYALRGGKKLRGYLVLEGARLHGVSQARALWPAAAIEAVHAYSLVHDDLPCMDDDDLRRGLPTVHRQWDEGTAVLVGDALQALGFELAGHEGAGSAEARADLMLSLARASGAGGMVLGQALDIAAAAAPAPLSLDEITALQAGKTGALFAWAAEAGARLAGADPAPLGRYAQAMGLAFQIADDILDIEGDAGKVGKAVGKDAAAGKATFVTLLGLAGAKRRAADLVTEACDALSLYGEGAQSLKEAARFGIARQN